MNTIKIIIADDHPVVRSGICHELSKHADFEVIRQTDNADDALSLTLEKTPDVLILDINMPGQIKVIDVIRKIKSKALPVRVLIITAYKEAGVVIGTIQAGADGYLLKEEDLESIPVAVRAIMKGDAWVSQGVTKVLTTRMRDAAQQPLITQRETEVLRLVCEGLTNDEIARELGITRRTVEFHMTNIMDKLGLTSRGKVIAWAKKNMPMNDIVHHQGGAIR